MDSLKSDLNHNTRKYNSVKNGGGEGTAGLPATPTVPFHRQFFLIH